MIVLFEEVGEPSRRSLLIEMISGPKTVTELCRATGLRQANASNHLGRLLKKQIVTRDKRGREAFYQIASSEMIEAISNLIPEAAERSDALDLRTLSELYFRAGVGGDEFTCSKIIDRAIRAGLTLISIDEDLIGAAIATASAMLRRREIDEAQEHMISNISERMTTRVAVARQSFIRIDRTALLMCAYGHYRSLNLRMTVDYLRSAGWHVLNVGQCVPAEAALKTISQHQPDLILLDLRDREGLSEALALVPRIKKSHEAANSKLGFSGAGAIECAAELQRGGADFIAHSLREFAYEILPKLDLPAHAGRRSRQ